MKSGRKRMRKSFLAIIYGMGISGFTLFLLIFVNAGYKDASRTFSVPYRIVFLMISIIYLVYLAKKNLLVSLGWLWIPLMTFWILYFLRIGLDGFVNALPLRVNANEYLRVAVGMTFVPMIGFLGSMGEKDNKTAFRSFIFVHSLVVLFVMVFYRNVFNSQYRSLLSKGIDAGGLISPITMSYIGVLTIAIGLWLILKGILRRKSLFKISIYLFIVFMGGLLLNLGATKSAMVSCLIVCFFLVLSQVRIIGVKRFLFLFMIVGVIGVILAVIVLKIDTGMMNRFRIFTDQIENDPWRAAGGRLSLIKTAFEQFWQSPFIGNAIEVDNYTIYPHNHISEAFMATGLFGGLAFLVLSIAALRRGFILLKNNIDYGWIVCLFVVFFVRGLFSLSISEPTLWYSMMGVFSAWFSCKSKSNQWGGKTSRCRNRFMKKGPGLRLGRVRMRVVVNQAVEGWN